MSLEEADAAFGHPQRKPRSPQRYKRVPGTREAPDPTGSITTEMQSLLIGLSRGNSVKESNNLVITLTTGRTFRAPVIGACRRRGFLRLDNFELTHGGHLLAAALVALEAERASQRREG